MKLFFQHFRSFFSCFFHLSLIIIPENYVIILKNLTDKKYNINYLENITLNLRLVLCKINLFENIKILLFYL